MSEEKKTPENNEEVVDTVEETEQSVENTEAEENQSTDESEEKVIDAEIVESEVKEEKKEEPKKKVDTSKGMNVWTAVLLGVALIVILAITMGKNGSWITDPDEWGQGGRRSYIWVEVNTVYQADQGANFTFTFPDEISGYSNQRFWIIENYIYDVWYCDDDGNTAIILHKCKKDDLLEADENTYLQSNIVTVNGIEVNERGSDGMVQSATWSYNGYYYQILTGEENMLEREYVESLISSIF